MQPTWLDSVIETNLHNGAAAIAQAIATSLPFVSAIQAGLSKQLEPTGPSRAQAIREEIKKLLC